MAEQKKSGASRLAVWIIVGLLMFGMVGFGAVGLNGTARNMGTVGDKPVSISSFATALQTDVNQAQQQLGRALTQPEIQALGLDQQALARVVNTRALDNLATEMGLSMGDARVREQVLQIPAFVGLDGEFDRVSYAEVLRRNNMNEADFENSLREDGARIILQEAVLAGVSVPDTMAEVAVAFLSETRDFSWAELTEANLITGITIPSDADLAAFHSENADLFTAPAAKAISYIWLTPEMMLDQVEVSSAELQDLYDAREVEFNQPARRLVERLVFATEIDAQAALDTITNGSATFEDVVEQRGLRLSDVDLGDLRQSELGDAGDAVFALDQPGVVGPLPSDLGPALFRVNAILEAQEQTLADVEGQLREEIATERAEGLVASLVENVDDLLASGATLEEVADETDLAFGQIDYHASNTDGIAGYEEFSRAALIVTEDDFPALENLSDGGIFALRFDGDVAAALRPLADVRAEVEAAFTNREVQTGLLDLANSIAPQVTADAPLASFGLVENIEEDMSRSDFVDNAAPSLVSEAFETAVGETRVIESGNGVIILRTNATHDADPNDEQTAFLQTLINRRLTNAVAQDIFTAFTNGARDAVDVSIDENTVRAVLANQGGGR